MIPAEAIAEIAAGKTGSNGSEPKAPKVTQLYGIEDLAKLPKPSYLLRPFLRTRGTNVMFGLPGAGKSLVALDWFMRIASGTPWFSGARPSQGPVVYIAAEGVHGLMPRINAWCEANGVEWPEDFKVWPEAVNFFTGETEALEAGIAALPKPPIAICVDTLARCMSGAEENSAKDMGKFIEHCERVAKRFDAALLIVHHRGKDGKTERGSGALRGASDLMVDVKMDGLSVKLTSERDKDAAPFDTWNLHLEPYGESVAIRPGGASGQLKESERTILEAVRRSFRTDWASTAKVKEAADLPKSSFYEALRGLVNGEYLEERSTGRQGNEYRIHPSVRERPEASGRTAENCPATPPSLDGVDGPSDSPVGTGENE